jgi:hypothetical protein
MVVAITLLVILFAEYRDNNFSTPNPDPPFSVVSLLQLTYLACAAGVALTKHRYVTLTSTRIRHASRLMSASEPNRAAGTIAICLGFASIGCAGYVLQPPPAILASVDWRISPHAAAVPVLWSALMSVCVASFGSNAHAAADAC